MIRHPPAQAADPLDPPRGQDTGIVSPSCEFFSRTELQTFDLMFKRRMLDAIRRGLETPTLGVFKSVKAKTKRA
jgi:hypothetical protein